MTNQSIRALYGSLVAMTLQLDNALSQKLDARGFLPCFTTSTQQSARRFSLLFLSVTDFGTRCPKPAGSFGSPFF
jgi:hypothetical protein